MPKTDSTLPTDWFSLGDMDMQAADILLAQNGPFPVVAFHLHQAIEKYLKGYLLSTGWPLRRIHDLETLVQEAINRDPAFASFLAPCQEIAEFYIETRYPIGVPSPLPASMLTSAFSAARELISLIKRKLSATQNPFKD